MELWNAPSAEASMAAASEEAGISIWSSAAGGAGDGGDWCDAIVRPDGTIALTIGDVSGHGAAVSESMRAIRRSIRHALRFMREPSDVLSAANDYVASRLDGRLVTAVVAVVDKRLGTLTYANAGHPAPLLLTQAQSRYLWQDYADVPLGVFAQHRARTHTSDLPDASLLLFYTDGITEHALDALRGEVELAEAARAVFEGPGVDDAREIAQRVLRVYRGVDDAAAMAFRARWLSATS